MFFGQTPKTGVNIDPGADLAGNRLVLGHCADAGDYKWDLVQCVHDDTHTPGT